MRLDKYLKNSRIIKRRTVAKDACEQGRVEVNGKIAKPGLELKIGDEIRDERKVRVNRKTGNVIDEERRRRF